jgi:hypothetical protein
MMFPKMGVQMMNSGHDIRFIESTKFIVDSDFFKDVRTVRLQRQVTKEQFIYFSRFLKKCSDVIGFWLVYEIDDVIFHEDIPNFNVAKAKYFPEFASNIVEMIKLADYVTVTTSELAKYYSGRCGAAMDKFVVVPNYIPKWWAGQVNVARRLDAYMEAVGSKRTKPRILFSGSMSHIDSEGRCGYDDYSHITEFIDSTTDEYEWMFIGGCPRSLFKAYAENRIKIVKGVDMLNYLQWVGELNPQCIVAPLMDCAFNRCKSNIRQLEGWSLGIPVIAQDVAAYNACGKKMNSLFTTADDLQNQLDGILKTKKTYFNEIKSGIAEMDSGGIGGTGWWLERNIGMWHDLSTMPQKTLRYDVRNFRGMSDG